MRRRERAITEIDRIEAMIQRAQVCRLGLHDQPFPYIVPMSFGYALRTLYFHCAPEGRKIDLIRRDARVCFELEAQADVIPHRQPCKWGVHYQSVIGFGIAELILDPEAKQQALDIIMQHYDPANGDQKRSYLSKAVDQTAVISVAIDHMTGKQAV